VCVVCVCVVCVCVVCVCVVCVCPLLHLFNIGSRYQL
jgi:hypothetical protein